VHDWTRQSSPFDMLRMSGSDGAVRAKSAKSRRAVSDRGPPPKNRPEIVTPLGSPRAM
jgi:hypothetical protein